MSVYFVHNTRNPGFISPSNEGDAAVEEPQRRILAETFNEAVSQKWPISRSSISEEQLGLLQSEILDKAFNAGFLETVQQAVEYAVESGERRALLMMSRERGIPIEQAIGRKGGLRQIIVALDDLMMNCLLEILDIKRNTGKSPELQEVVVFIEPRRK